MAKPKTKKILKMKDGAEYEITAENGKYYVCGKTQFKKLNPAIEGVAKIKREEERTEEE